MADNNRTHGYRANDPYGRPRADAPGDPLAELARLIGQQNESAPSYRQNGAPAGAYAQGQGYEQGHGSEGWSEPAHDPYAPQENHDPQGHQQPVPQAGYGGTSHDPYAEQRYADQHYAEQNYQSPPAYGEPGAGSYSDPRYADSSQQDPRYGDPRYADPNGYGAGSGYPDQQGYSDPRYAAASYDSQAYGQAQGGYAQDSYLHVGQPQDPAYDNMPSFARPGAQAGYDNRYYDNAPRSGLHMPVPEDHAPARRRGSIVTVLAVLALAVVGTAAAFGYRAMFGSSGTAVPPPVIRADPRPSKVVPVSNDPNAKPIQDRIGGNAERVVSREEAPVDSSRGANPRVIFPNLAEQSQKPAVSANIASTGSAPVAGSGEPKKIRTVAIKPDQGAARSAPPAAEPELANTRAQANGPLTLSPNAPAPAAPPPQRHAARPATNGVAAPFPAPIASQASAAVAGGYAVQVTSQRSEADAQASYKSLQSQFPAVLGSRQSVIRKADLGDKGTYYRAQIPFSSQTEASDFCSSLKAAGGQCVVQKN
jgi:hypothetical protein